jgi:hypothetical protein
MGRRVSGHEDEFMAQTLLVHGIRNRRANWQFLAALETQYQSRPTNQLILVDYGRLGSLEKKSQMTAGASMS